MRGKKTDRKVIAEIAELLKLHRPADVVAVMAGRLPRRTVYRLIAELKAEDEKRKLEEAERFFFRASNFCDSASSNRPHAPQIRGKI
jgi:hypothetical protein